MGGHSAVRYYAMRDRALAWHRFVSARTPGFRDEDTAAVPYGLRLFLADGPIGSWR